MCNQATEKHYLLNKLARIGEITDSIWKPMLLHRHKNNNPPVKQYKKDHVSNFIHKIKSHKLEGKLRDIN